MARGCRGCFWRGCTTSSAGRKFVAHVEGTVARALRPTRSLERPADTVVSSDMASLSDMLRRNPRARSRTISTRARSHATPLHGRQTATGIPQKNTDERRRHRAAPSSNPERRPTRSPTCMASTSTTIEEMLVSSVHPGERQRTPGARRHADRLRREPGMRPTENGSPLMTAFTSATRPRHPQDALVRPAPVRRRGFLGGSAWPEPTYSSTSVVDGESDSAGGPLAANHGRAFVPSPIAPELRARVGRPAQGRGCGPARCCDVASVPSAADSGLPALT